MNDVVRSSRPGMGGIPYPDGTTFRVWAPHAGAVAVAGTFNQWSAQANPLAAEGNGWWSADVAGAAPGDRYKYVITLGEQAIWRTDPYARDVTSSVGDAVIYDPNAYQWQATDYSTPPWHQMVIYELHVGTFNDEPGGAPGNFEGVIRKLPYLRELGINTIKMMPPTEFAGGFSWGYNPAHIFALEEDYGASPDAFKRLVDAAHALGIAVIFDVVYNHFGPSDLDLWQFDGWSENGKGGIYFYNDWRSATPWGDTRPDYGRGEVRQYIRDNALMWLDEYRVDGLRWDATAYIRNVHGAPHDHGANLHEGWTLMQWINAEIDRNQPWKISIAEDLRDDPWITGPTGAGGAGFDAQWDAGFVHPIRAAITAREDHERDMNAVRAALYHNYNGDPFQRIVYTESHDEVANGKARVPEEIWPGNASSWFSKKRSTLGAGLVFTAPGIPMIFQGQEFLEDEWFRDTHPIDFGRREIFAGIVRLYTDLIRLRRNGYDNTRGLSGPHVNVHHLNQADKVVAFHRWDRGGPRDDVLILANFSSRSSSRYTVGFPREGAWKVRFNSDWNGYDPEFGNFSSFDTYAHRGARDAMPAHGDVGLGPYSVVILSQDD